MDPVVFWVVQALGVVTTLITVLSFSQREKWKMMLCLTATNISMIATYILCGSVLGGLLVTGAMVRTIVYFLYSRQNKKPEPIIMIMFELYYIIIAIIMLRNKFEVYELLMLVNLIVVTYTSWQNDVRILRLGYIFSSLLLIPYDALLGAYSTILSEVLMLGSVAFSLIKYAKVTHSSEDVAQRYFRANKNFWGSSVEVKDNYDTIFSTGVDRTPFYNFCILKNHDKIYDTILDIKKECQAKSVKEVAYLPFNAKIYDRLVSDANMLNIFFPIEFHDVWMRLIDGFNLNNTKCKLQNVEYKEVDESKIGDVIEVYLKGYREKTDTSEKSLTDEEKVLVENLKHRNLTDTIDGIKISAYVAYYQGVPISLVCMLSNNVEAFVTKVSTIPAFRRKHVASSLMQYAINKHRIKGIQEIILCTDKYSTNEKFYAFNSFVEFAQAFALNVADITKYQAFIDSRKI